MCLTTVYNRYKAIAVMAGDGREDDIEYWHDAREVEVAVDNGKQTVRHQEEAGWKHKRPPADMVRVPGLVHETSTLYMSDDLENDPQASVDSLYRPRKCDNVYVTGGALFPTSGSWNRECSPLAYVEGLSYTPYSYSDDVRLRARFSRQDLLEEKSQIPFAINLRSELMCTIL